ncbi:related to ABC transporter family members [Ustilago trichophora]|uniref:Related to ABC transporter family members n=1 Tax=Ustilago trichophora TaxID=86804 RepID=A0A5C3EB71_9BASI|nr:related to ABC transporter family members [Ustilago trichophora]
MMRSIPTLLRTVAPRSPLTSIYALHSVAPNPRFSSSTPSSPSPLPPIFKLENALLSSSPSSTPLNWTINDAGNSECWAIIAPASQAGGAVRRELISILSGQLRPRLSPSNLQHPPPHPFLSSTSNQTSLHATKAIKHVSFATKIGASSSSSNDFTNYSARYGAIREGDRITLYERLMDLLDCPVGLIAAQKLVPDPFTSSSPLDQVGLFKYKSASERQQALRKATQADKIIKSMAPLLLIDEELLHRPVIALSNGQTRRARILSSLISGAEMVVLEEPFSGIDAGTRVKLNTLFEDLHAKRRPRLVLVLREQDAVPELVTHVLKVDDDGEITSIGPRNSDPCSCSSTHKTEPAPGGPHIILSNSRSNTGTGDKSSPPLVNLNNVSIVYGEKTVLDRITFSIHPGQRVILAGDNGSGKTTLLALLLGDHPKSFSFDSETLSLFSHARDHPSNARMLLNRRLGHLSPELYNAFPRRSVCQGGLTVGEVIASGFENVFARRRYTHSQKHRVYALLEHFHDLIKSPHHQTSKHDSDIATVSNTGFSNLSNGSQALVLFLRSIVSNPPLLVLDEPFQAMDKNQVHRTTAFLDHPHLFPIGSSPHQILADLQQRSSIAIILVSHYQDEWPKTFGSLLRLSHGKVVERI